MADRTFTSSDVLRIFEFHLDETERETVRMFFLEPSDINRDILTRLLRLFTNFIPLFTTPLVGLIVSLIPGVASMVYFELVGEIFRVRGNVARELERIDA